ncbi:hypothetical protein CEE36_06485 [candidate division TA06 bacterium B3_TA06]|uniref:Outer membrane protein beta-barrel domain-containing protein n=1 Tax=candidate division TA06 bacterium B3_TA06 TaxID=2012487 RepID=A0A532V6A2_UNCT6|nr:MAG: hypothetical protein CEE36_06485 [candidate division TA06 bacterium B3_TA06]
MKKATSLLLAVVIAALAYTPNSFRYASTAGILWDDYDWFLADPARIPLIEGYQLYTNLANFVTAEEHPLSDSIGFQGPGFYLIGGKGWGPPLGAAGVFDTRMLRFADSIDIDGDTYWGHGAKADTNYQVDPDDGSIIGTDIATEVVDAYHTRNDFDGYLGLGYTLGETFSMGLGYYHGSNKISWFPADNNQIISNYSYTTGLDTYDTAYSFNEFTTTEMSNRIKLGAWTEIDYLQLSGYLGADIFSGNKGLDTLYRYSLAESYPGLDTRTDTVVNNLGTWPYSGMGIPVELLGIYEIDEGQEVWFFGGVEYRTWRWKDGAGITDVSIDTLLEDYEEPPDTFTRTTANINSTLAAGSGSYSGLAYNLGVKGVFAINEMVTFGLGVHFAGSSGRDSTYNDHTDSTLTSLDDGDGMGEVTDVTTTTLKTYSDYLVNEAFSMAFHFPVGVEFTPLKWLALRLGATYVHEMSTYRTWAEATSAIYTETYTQFGDGTSDASTTYLPYDIGHAEGEQKETLDKVTYDFGIGFKITKNLQIDLMGFSDLTDMGNWKLSAIFKF